MKKKEHTMHLPAALYNAAKREAKRQNCHTDTIITRALNYYLRHKHEQRIIDEQSLEQAELSITDPVDSVAHESSGILPEVHGHESTAEILADAADECRFGL